MKTLISVNYVLDVEDFDALAKLIQCIEDAAGAAMRKSLGQSGATWEEISEVLEFYGISASPIRETLDSPA